jgi:alkanesulfonate monooxygenase SsuD/methylene tetrahydromethanopterin reductase-like flavin-dependent oxidoreductase (luciferase family)
VPSAGNTEQIAPLRVGVCHLPGDPAVSLTLARAAEDAGVSVFGVADSPHLFGAMYPVVQHVLAGTSQMRVGPMVTNPVTQHPSVHAASLAALTYLYPGRVIAAFGTGDSAVRSVGLSAASPAQLAASMGQVADRVGNAAPLWAAVSGPRAAAAVPAAASAILLGGGLDAGRLEYLGGLADQAAGHRLERWAFLVGCLVPGPQDVAAARRASAASVVSVSRHGMTRDPAAAGAPVALIPGLRAIYGRYDVHGHGNPEGVNARLLADWPAEAGYLFDRFAAVGTPADLVSRLRSVAHDAHLTGLILSSTVPDPLTHIRLLGTDLQTLLNGPHAGHT